MEMIREKRVNKSSNDTSRDEKKKRKMGKLGDTIQLVNEKVLL